MSERILIFEDREIKVQSIPVFEIDKFKGNVLDKERMMLFLKKYTDASDELLIDARNSDESWRSGLLEAVIKPYRCDIENGLVDIGLNFVTRLESNSELLRAIRVLIEVGYKYTELIKLTEKELWETFLIEGWAKSDKYNFGALFESMIGETENEDLKAMVTFYKNITQRTTETDNDDIPEDLIETLKGL